MANYAIGDIQGCYKELIKLLENISFNPSKDKLWLSGDIVNRGPDSLKCLKLVFSFRDSCNIVLGNHDLHFIAVAKGIRKLEPNDTFKEALENKKLPMYVDWLKSQPLMQFHAIETIQGTKRFLMTHAGIPPHWNLQDLKTACTGIEKNLYDEYLYKSFLRNMYGNQPTFNKSSLNENDILRLNTNYLTRMRFCKKDGKLDLLNKGPANIAPSGYKPWFRHQLKLKSSSTVILFGHWAALGGITGIKNIIALDTGCAWGYKLTALRLEDDKVFSYKSLKK